MRCFREGYLVLEEEVLVRRGEGGGGTGEGGVVRSCVEDYAETLQSRTASLVSPNYQE